MTKKDIREVALKRRNEFSAREVEEKSRSIMNRVESLEVFKRAQHVLSYHSHQKEVSTLAWLEKWIPVKKIYLPTLVSEDQMEAYLCEDLKTLKSNQYHILEPTPENLQAGPELELILVPGVAFDLKGYRIGKGKGYYDRFLSKHPHTFRIGLAYEAQIFDELPHDLYDERVHMIVTEKRVIHVDRL